MGNRPNDEETWALQKMWIENPPELMEGTGPAIRMKPDSNRYDYLIY